MAVGALECAHHFCHDTWKDLQTCSGVPAISLSLKRACLMFVTYNSSNCQCAFGLVQERVANAVRVIHVAQKYEGRQEERVAGTVRD